jgi:stearoyl-CoA desaturase (delta-9 desaturase)
MRGTTSSDTRPTPAATTAWAAVIIGLPLLAAAGAVYLWRPPTAAEIAVAAILYCVGGLGISLGWHRYFVHRGFRCGPRLEYVLAIAGSTACEGSLASWVANHRAHHAHTDRHGDPHSPWTEHGPVRGFWHAHVGWLRRPGADVDRLARDITRDSVLARCSNRWWLYTTASIVLPGMIAGAVAGVERGIGMLLWAGVLRVVCFHHVTWSVNSVCHMFGARRHETNDQSRNVAVLALASFGESWHNNHHHAPRVARHGTERGQVDITAGLLRCLERLGIVSQCVWSDRTDRRH